MNNILRFTHQRHKSCETFYKNKKALTVEKSTDVFRRRETYIPIIYTVFKLCSWHGRHTALPFLEDRLDN
jgi:hypothetical protein